jgi:hypothetical protein
MPVRRIYFHKHTIMNMVGQKLLLFDRTKNIIGNTDQQRPLPDGLQDFFDRFTAAPAML